MTFSGLDGAGKSTIIGALRAHLMDRGHKVTVLTMYDDIGLYAWVRKLRAWRSGTTDLTSESTKVGATAVLAVRSPRVKRVVYWVDLAIFSVYRLWHEFICRRVLILDRYFYDSLADVADGYRWNYVWTFMKLVPPPTVPILLDTSPEDSYRRKGEYSVDYLARRQTIYHRIFSRVRRPVVISNDILEDTVRSVQETVSARLTSQRHEK